MKVLKTLLGILLLLALLGGSFSSFSLANNVHESYLDFDGKNRETTNDVEETRELEEEIQDALK